MYLLGQLVLAISTGVILWKVSRLHPVENLACWMMLCCINLDFGGITFVNLGLLAFQKTPEVFWGEQINSLLIQPFLILISLQSFFAASSTLLHKAAAILSTTMIYLLLEFAAVQWGVLSFVRWTWLYSILSVLSLIAFAIMTKYFTAYLLRKGVRSS